MCAVAGARRGKNGALRKAQIAAENRFEGRVCGELWTLAYVFKAYQLFPPKPTARAACRRPTRRRNSLGVSLSLSL